MTGREFLALRAGDVVEYVGRPHPAMPPAGARGVVRANYSPRGYPSDRLVEVGFGRRIVTFGSDPSDTRGPSALERALRINMSDTERARRMEGAGVLFVEPRGRILLLRRSADVPDPGLWNSPGGAVRPDESSLDAALREAEEECGPLPAHQVVDVVEWHDRETGFGYSLYVATVRRTFTPTLNWENDDWRWWALHAAAVDERVHPHLREQLDELLGRP